MARLKEDTAPVPPMLGGIEAAYIPPKKPSVFKAVMRRVIGGLIVLCLVGVLFVILADTYVRLMARSRLHDLTEDVQPGRPALVFGCSPRISGGGENTYFRGRIEAAAHLYRDGKVTFIIVSGDNSTDAYNEPRAMRKALEKRGVPTDRIICDYAGLRTLDSVVRLKEVFGQHEAVFVTQRFQNERAIFLARHYGIEAEGFNAGGEPGGVAFWRNWGRERLARVRMLLDLYILDTAPRHLGPRETVPGPMVPAPSNSVESSPASPPQP